MKTSIEKLESTVKTLWAEATRTHSSADLSRMEVFFDVASGQRAPVQDDSRRELHTHLFVPGLRAQPWWDAAIFPAARKFEWRYPLIVEEARRLLAQPHVFASPPGRGGHSAPGTPGSPIEGQWCGYYLQQHLRRLPVAAAHAPITLRTLDGIPPAREAMLSFLGPYSRIKRHSDKVNFVITLYLPLFAHGAWLLLGGERRQWTDGRCMAADSTFFHESVNDGASWRGLLLVDMWHPDLTDVECAVLERAVPVINDILRSDQH